MAKQLEKILFIDGITDNLQECINNSPQYDRVSTKEEALLKLDSKKYSSVVISGSAIDFDPKDNILSEAIISYLGIPYRSQLTYQHAAMLEVAKYAKDLGLPIKFINPGPRLERDLKTLCEASIKSKTIYLPIISEEKKRSASA